MSVVAEQEKSRQDLDPIHVGFLATPLFRFFEDCIRTVEKEFYRDNPDKRPPSPPAESSTTK